MKSMKIITKKVKVNNLQYYRVHLNLINSILLIDDKKKMSAKEIEVLAAFLSQDEVLIKDDMFNGIVRKKVMDSTGIKPGGLSNHLKSLIDKGFLMKDEITKKISVKEFLMPIKNGQGYRLMLVK